MSEPKISIRSPHLEGAEVAWFAPLCNGETELPPAVEAKNGVLM